MNKWQNALMKPEALALIALPLWFLILETASWANTHSFAHRSAVMISLGFLIYGLGAVNILGMFWGIWRFRRSGRINNVISIGLNALEAIAIIALIVMGTALNAQK
jgi:hypothetical protein